MPFSSWWWWSRRPGGGVVTAPSDPTNLTATFVSATRIDLAWDDNANNELGYKIERKVDAGDFAEIDAVATPDLEAYTDNTVVEDTTYTYRVRAYRAGSVHSGYATSSAVETLPRAPQNLTLVLSGIDGPPSAPSGTTVTFNAQDDIDIEWTDNSGNETEFAIARQDNGGLFVDLFTAAADATSFTDTTVPRDTVVAYQVKAVNSYGASAYSASDSTTTLPNAPTGLTLTVVSDTAIDLDWVDESEIEDNYKVERKVLAGAFAVINTPAADAESYSDTGLTAATTYVYRVRAQTAAGFGEYSDEVMATTNPAPVPPDAPSGLGAAFVSNNRIDLTWSDNSDNELGFIVSRSADGGAESDIATISTPNTVTYSDTTTVEDTSYAYRVRAYNITGESAKSAAVTIPTRPAAPSVLAAVAASASQINLTWSDNSSVEDVLKVERKTGIGGTYSQIVALPPDAVSFSATGLTDSTTYYFRVRANNISGDSSYSNEANATTDAIPPPPTLPNPPTGLAATFVSNSNISLVWGDSATNEVGFKVSRSANGGAFGDIATIAVANTTSYSDTTVSADNTYQYRVRAYNGVGDSANSNTASVVTRPSAPTSVNASAVSDTQINLTWTDNSDVETSFTIERSLTNTAGSYSTLATVPANTVAYSDTGLAPSTIYYYRARANNASGSSSNSTVTSATTQATPTVPAMPGNFAPVFVTNSRIDMTWTDVTGETSYKIERGDNGGAFSQIATPAANATSYSDTTVSADNSYTYRMRAANAVGNGPYTGDATVVTLCAAPSSLTVTGTTTSTLQLTWSDNSSVELGYRVYRDLELDGTFALLATLPADSVAYLDTGLSASQTVHYRVAAFNVNGETITATASGTTQAGTTIIQFAGDYPTGFTVQDDEVGQIIGTVTSAANVVVHGRLIMRPGATLRFRDINNSLFSFDPPHVLGIDESDVGLWIHGNGVLDALGTAKTPWMRVVGNISAGATTLSMADPYTLAATAPTGWLAGDEVLVAPTTAGDTEPEVRTIQSVSGSTVTLTSALTKAHPSVTFGNGDILTAEICNLTRDVRIEGTPTGYTHILFMDHDPPLGGLPQTIKYVQIRYSGVSKPATASQRDASGRYGIHFHMMENGTQGTLVEGLVVRDGQAHAIVTHKSHGVTWDRCIAHNTHFDAYWWDVFDPGAQSTDTDFTETNDLLYSQCIASRTGFPAGERGNNNGQFNLSRGTNMTIERCVGFACKGDREASTFQWPSTANFNPNVWIVHDIVAHNNDQCGARVWQNDAETHIIDNFHIYHCPNVGIAMGAYSNRGYRWSNIHVLGSNATDSEGFLHHTAAGPSGPLAAPRSDGYQHSWDTVTMKNLVWGHRDTRHNKLPSTATLIKDIEYSNLTSGVMVINELANPEDPNGGWHDFVNCTRDGNVLVRADFVFVQAWPGLIIRVQNGSSAWQMDHEGTVTTIPVFYPNDPIPT